MKTFQLHAANNDDLLEKLIIYIPHLLNFLSFRTKSLSEKKEEKRETVAAVELRNYGI